MSPALLFPIFLVLMHFGYDILIEELGDDTNKEQVGETACRATSKMQQCDKTQEIS